MTVEEMDKKLDSRMTVTKLIEILKGFPQDMIVCTDGDLWGDPEITIKTWIHSNYPYNLPNKEYVSID